MNPYEDTKVHNATFPIRQIKMQKRLKQAHIMAAVSVEDMFDSVMDELTLAVIVKCASNSTEQKQHVYYTYATWWDHFKSTALLRLPWGLGMRLQRWMKPARTQSKVFDYTTQIHMCPHVHTTTSYGDHVTFLLHGVPKGITEDELRWLYKLYQAVQLDVEYGLCGVEARRALRALEYQKELERLKEPQ